jgi:carotenoid cleavage dioxygenase-like enzyme
MPEQTARSSVTTTESPTQSPNHTFLEGNFAPVDAEVTAWDLHVRGAIPPELSGTYVRNGPNPVAPDPSNYHWFIGEGMVHGVHLGGGRAQWYRNRWVRSPKVARYKGLDPVPADVGGFSPGPGNTNIVGHAGSLWALTEGSLPYRLDDSLETLSQENFGGTLPYGINAHPKIDPVTGSMHVMSYHFLEPVIGYHEIDAQGHLVRSELLETAKPVMVHDMAMTASRIIAMDLPVVFDMDMATAGRAMPFRWDDDYVPRIGVMPRSGTAADTVWIEVEPCYVFHPLNAYDDGDTVVLDVARHRTMFRHDLDDDSDGRPQLMRWRLNTVTGTSSSELIDDRAQEFPRIDERLTGLQHRYGYAAGVGIAQMGGGSEVSTSVFKHDLQTGASTVHEMGPGRSTGEFVFVASSPDAGEDEGWLMGYVYDAATDRSELVILDATDVAGDPVAVVEMPVRIPAGFHGNWVAS